jgi:hypothetical protein
MPKDKNCPKCHGTGSYMYDEHHGTICDLCCDHAHGWWVLREHYGKNNNKFCCLGGCGYTLSPSAIKKLLLGKKIYHLYNNGILWGLLPTKTRVKDVKKRLSPENKKAMKVQFKYYIKEIK